MRPNASDRTQAPGRPSIARGIAGAVLRIRSDGRWWTPIYKGGSTRPVCEHLWALVNSGAWPGGGKELPLPAPTDSGREPLDSSGSCCPNSAANQMHQSASEQTTWGHVVQPPSAIAMHAVASAVVCISVWPI
jgi:hypothetical protein